MDFLINLVSHATIGDALWLVAGILAAWWRNGAPALPKPVKEWIKKLGGEANIIDILYKAAEFTSYSGAQKRQWAYDEIIKLAKKNGLVDKNGKVLLPDWIINMIIEWVFAKLRIKGDL